jgi:hypothetical protein
VFGVMVEGVDQRFARAFAGDGVEVPRPIALLGEEVCRSGRGAMDGIGGHTL